MINRFYKLALYIKYTLNQIKQLPATHTGEQLQYKNNWVISWEMGKWVSMIYYSIRIQWSS